MALEGAACPSPIHADTLPKCDTVAPGDMCEGDGECSTNPALNLCHGYRDVYRREACIPLLDGASGSQRGSGSRPGGPSEGVKALEAGAATAVVTALLLVLALFCYRCRQKTGVRRTTTSWTLGLYAAKPTMTTLSVSAAATPAAGANGV